jgi:hypothetical protein
LPTFLKVGNLFHKFYFSINEKLNSPAEFDAVNKKLDEKIKAIIADMKLK